MKFKLLFFLFFWFLVICSSSSLERNGRYVKKSLKRNNFREFTDLKGICAANTFTSACEFVFSQLPPSWGNLAINKTGNTYTVKLSDVFSLNTMVKKYPQSIQGLYEKLGLNGVSFNNPEVSFYLKDSTNAGVKLSTKVSLFNAPEVEIDVMYAYANGTHKFLGGLKVPFSSLHAVVKKFVDNELVNKVLSAFQSSEFVVALYNNDFSDYDTFKPDYLSGASATEEATLLLQMAIKAQPNGGAIGSWMANNLGVNSQFVLRAIISLSKFEASAGLENFQIGEKLLLKNAEIYFSITYDLPNDMGIGIRAALEWTLEDGQKLTFSGDLKFTTIEIQLSFRMSSIYKSAFGIERLNFGNLMIGGGISYAGAPSAIALEAEMALGKDCYGDGQTFVGDGFCLRGRGAISVNLLNPKENYFSLDIAPISASVIMKALIGDKNTADGSISKILSDLLSMPDGLKCSYSANPNGVNKDGLVIPGGFFFQTTFRFLSMDTKFTLNYNAKASSFMCELDVKQPISFYSVVGLYHYSDDTKGPYFKFDVAPNKLELQLSARLYVFAVQFGINLSYSKEYIKVTVSGTIFWWFSVSFTMEGSVAEMKKGNWKFSGSFGLGSFSFKKNSLANKFKSNRMANLIRNVDQTLLSDLRDKALRLKKSGHFKALMKRPQIKKLLKASENLPDASKTPIGCTMKDFCHHLRFRSQSSSLQNDARVLAAIAPTFEGNVIVVNSITFDYGLDDKTAADMKNHKLPLQGSMTINNQQITFNETVKVDSNEELQQILYNKAKETLIKQGKKVNYYLL